MAAIYNTTLQDPHNAMRQSSGTINILVATFAGSNLPRTLTLPISRETPIGDVFQAILRRLPIDDDSLIISTVSNKQLLPSSDAPVATLLGSQDDNLLSLRISRRLCGGKGGFGSQLRAAGGRMSSRKNRDRQNVNGSNRNLDGRRLRTVDEAKKLAEYLAMKPDMEKREKEQKKKRWQDVIDASERREEEIRSGKVGSNQGRLNAEYVESKENAEEKTREAVLKAARDGVLELVRTGSESSLDPSPGSEDDAGTESSSSSNDRAQGSHAVSAGSNFFGWDEEDEDEDEDNDEDDEDDASDEDEEGADDRGQTAARPYKDDEQAYEGKGKTKAT